MANVVEVQITGKDLTQRGVSGATTNLRNLGKEVRSVGQVMNATGNIASAVGNVAFANFANQATLVAAAGAQIATSFKTANAAIKTTIVGLAAAGIAYGVSKLIEAKEATEKLTEDTKKYEEALNGVFIKIQEIGNAELAELQANKAANIERMRAVQELTVDQDKKNLFMLRSTELSQKQETKIIADQSEARAKKKEEEVKKKKALEDQYLTAASNAAGDLATIALAFGKKGFAAYKAFAIAQAMIDAYKAANAAYAALAGIPFVGPALGAAAAAVAIAAGLANAAKISSMKPPQAHSGLDYVPQDATYVLKKGEMVLDPGTSESVRNAATRGGGMMVNLYIDGVLLARSIGQWSRDGRLNLSAKAIS